MNLAKFNTGRLIQAIALIKDYYELKGPAQIQVGIKLIEEYTDELELLVSFKAGELSKGDAE